MTAALRTTLDTIGASGAEDALAIEAVLGGTSSASTPPSTTARTLDDLDRFFAANPDVLEYFIPEATEHLDAAAQSLLAVERDGANEAEIARLFRAVHTLKGAAYTVGCPPIGDLAHRIEDVLGEVREGRRTLDAPVLEVVFAGLDTLRLLVRTDAGLSPERGQALDRMATLLAALPAAGEAAAMVAAPTSEPPIADAAATAAASETIVPAAPRLREEEPREIRPSIRVNLDRLDALMNLVGELVIARGRLERDLGRLDDLGGLLNFTQARMGHTVAEFESKYHNPRLPRAPGPQEDVFGELEFDRYDDFNLLARRIREIANDVSEIEGQLAAMVRAVREDAARVQQLSGELRGEITRARMVPIGRLFARFARQVREAARAEGKTVALEIQGETVEVDNTIVQQLADPLLHLIQNAVAHGIEPADERQARGKPPHGTVRLSAAHRGGAIHVEIADDGRGIDLEMVKQWALARGFLTAEAAAVATDRDLLDLIFLPGFSTAASVTTTAGRGVGMDVVRTDVARLGGDIDVSTEIGVGTTFTLKLPLTVAVSDAVMVRVGTEIFAVAVSAVRATLRVHSRDITTTDGIERVRVEDQMAEVLPLGRLLGVQNSERPGVVPFVAVRAGRRTLAVAVDELLGKEEIVVKSLGRFLDGIGPFAGATVSPEGRVILLLDPLKLADMRSTDAPVPAPRPSEPVVNTRRPRVLLVDDSISVRKFVGQMLERAAFTVVTAIDGVEALERLAEAPANVIVTDLEMPRLNGYELVRDLKRRPATRDIPIIVLTTRAGEKHANLARELGVSHYATKPVEEEAFVRLVESLAMPAGMVA
jgi:chemosensory pili system protein ChpA (sensor histidine kinase/response regulator)